MATLIMMLKAAQAGRAKTRLAQGLGAVGAVTVYRRLSAPLTWRLGRDARWTLELRVTPDDWVRQAGRGPGAWAPARRRPQGHGDLGARMERALRAAPWGPVVMIGGDCPAVRPEHIAQAFKALGQSDAVFGPAEDGGYWLIGLQRRPFPDRLFQGVRWSGPHALSDTLANLRPRFTTAFLETLSDIDTAQDWERWRRRGSTTSVPG